MLETPCHIISDIHLGVASKGVEQSFLRYLRVVPAQAKSLVINGDLFDFWFEWKSVIPRPGFRVLAELAAIRDNGVEILWVAGNHDCWGGEILRQDVGVTYQLGSWEGEIGPWRAQVEHGDGLRYSEDRRYRMIRPVMRSPTAMRLFRRLHPDRATRIAMGSSAASRTYRAKDEGRGLQAIGHRRLLERPELDLVVFGHSHVAALERVPNAGIFGNAGSWLDAPTYLEITDERIALKEWDGSSQGHSLDVIDR